MSKCAGSIVSFIEFPTIREESKNEDGGVIVQDPKLV